MKKLMILVLALLMTVAMTACGSDNKDSKADTTEAPATTEAPKTSEASTEAPATEAPTTAEPTTEAPTTAEPTTEEPTTEEPTTEEPTTEAPATEEATTEEVASEPAGDTAYVNFDKMHFWINGVEFVLGESTLQDMIDSGVVPFRADDLEDAGNNLKKNTQSSASISTSTGARRSTFSTIPMPASPRTSATSPRSIFPTIRVRLRIS